MRLIGAALCMGCLLTGACAGYLLGQWLAFT